MFVCDRWEVGGGEGSHDQFRCINANSVHNTRASSLVPGSSAYANANRKPAVRCCSGNNFIELCAIVIGRSIVCWQRGLCTQKCASYSSDHRRRKF